MILQACLNGARQRSEHPRLPTAAEELAADAARVVKAGANEIHLHVRGLDGSESLDPSAVGRTLEQVRRAVPGTLIGVSTGAWIEGGPERTLHCIGAWTGRPDHASVNLGETGALDVIGRLRRIGVAVEAGLASTADAEQLIASGEGGRCLRVLIELDREQTTAEAVAAAEAMLGVLTRAGLHKPILLHGFDQTVWPMLDYAIARGFSVRAGLEDGLTLPDGSTAEDNAAIIANAFKRMHAGRPTR